MNPIEALKYAFHNVNKENERDTLTIALGYMSKREIKKFEEMSDEERKKLGYRTIKVGDEKILKVIDLEVGFKEDDDAGYIFIKSSDPLIQEFAQMKEMKIDLTSYGLGDVLIYYEKKGKIEEKRLRKEYE